jgi:nucleoside-diphosphate-sugar epimerase
LEGDLRESHRLSFEESPSKNKLDEWQPLSKRLDFPRISKSTLTHYLFMIASGVERKVQKCVLLTGGTGFLGQYLLKDLLLSGVEVVTVARSRYGVSAKERVHRIVRIWEQSLGCELPRPTVIEWDLHSPPDRAQFLSGLGEVRERIQSVLHVAASVRFSWDRNRIEPFRSNIEGTRHVADFAALLDRPDFHFVSTAYVWGETHGKAQEVLPTSPTFRNPYEESKFLAEKLLLDRKHQFGSLTIYRPSIVVGDSQTGFASQFQTIYSGLRLTSLYRATQDSTIASIFKKLGVEGHRGKNLIPVDVVSRAIRDLLLNEEAHGKTYHLTSTNRVSIDMIADAMKRAAEHEPVAWCSTEAIDDVALAEATSAFLDSFAKYFSDDPDFDNSQTRDALPPSNDWELHSDQLVRMFRYAIRENFEEAENKPENEIISKLKELNAGIKPNVSVHAKPWVVQAIQRGELTMQAALQSGAIVVIGARPRDPNWDAAIWERLRARDGNVSRESSPMTTGGRS